MDMPMVSLPQPPVLTAEAQHFFAAAAAGRLELQACNACGTVWFYPRPACSACGATDYHWQTMSGQGIVASFSIVHRAPSPEFRAKVPYVVAMIDLAEGPRMMANIVGDDAREVAIDDAVQVVFEARGEGTAMPQFERAGADE
jgi:uncharacterized OB-fold protein